MVIYGIIYMVIHGIIYMVVYGIIHMVLIYVVIYVHNIKWYNIHSSYRFHYIDMVAGSTLSMELVIFIDVLRCKFVGLAEKKNEMIKI